MGDAIGGILAILILLIALGCAVGDRLRRRGPAAHVPRDLDGRPIRQPRRFSHTSRRLRNG